MFCNRHLKVKNSLPFMYREDSLPRSQESMFGPGAGPGESNPHSSVMFS